MDERNKPCLEEPNPRTGQKMEQKDLEAYENLSDRIPAKQLSTLLKFSSSLASTMDLAEVLQIAVESAVEMLAVDTGAVYTLENETLVLGATSPPLPPQFPDELRFAHLKDHLHIREAVTTLSPVYLQNAPAATLSAAERSVVDSRGLVSILYFPLVLKKDAIGVFIIGSTRNVRQFSNSEIELSYVLSSQVSLAIANAQLYKKAQDAIVELTRAYDATLEGWSRVLDMRDHVTDEHTQRVASLTVALARRMGIPESELEQIHRGALIHDIGKMAIPDNILQKPDVLSDTEKASMQTHPEKAFQILSQIDYLLPAIDIPYCHHEKWDGTGYPRGLKGEEIPLPARIFAVVDVFDALTSDRPYRKAWSQEKALSHILEQSGKQFYPEAVKAFSEMIKESKER
jgi:putative nucleotidyltransferase with HDIG domain